MAAAARRRAARAPLAPVGRAPAAAGAPVVPASPAQSDRNKRLAEALAAQVAEDPAQVSRLVQMVDDNPSNLHAAFELIKLLDGTNAVPRDEARIVQEFKRLLAHEFPGAKEAADRYAQREHNVELGMQLLNAGYVGVTKWLERNIDMENTELVSALRRHAIEHPDIGLLVRMMRKDVSLVEAAEVVLERLASMRPEPQLLEEPAGGGAAAGVPKDEDGEGGDDEDSEHAQKVAVAHALKAQHAAWHAVLDPLEQLLEEWLKGVDADRIDDASRLLEAMARSAPDAYVPEFLVNGTLNAARSDIEGQGGAATSVRVLRAFAPHILSAAATMAAAPELSPLVPLGLFVMEAHLGKADEADAAAAESITEFVRNTIGPLGDKHALFQAVRRLGEEWSLPALHAALIPRFDWSCTCFGMLRR